ncbi:hypothetical protein BRD17_09850 [Halobacteriales archaeon SW_7_68_16]|nr:MAG: hypothetical protein BRD17_09850 [Halobacteriales archaeon SW_7_68_16]
MNGPARVLCVDDDPAFGRLLVRRLTEESRRIEGETTTDPDEAIERVRDPEAHVDAVVSDHRMPAMSGLDLLASIREFDPDIPFVLYTGRGDEETAMRAIDLNVTAYVRKEPDEESFADLAERITGAVREYRAEGRSDRYRIAVETTREGIAIVGADGTFEFANEAFLDLYGYERGDLVGRPWQLAHPGHEVERVEDEVFPAVEDEGSWAGRSVGVRADGSQFPESKTITALPDGGLAVVVIDLTDAKPFEPGAMAMTADSRGAGAATGEGRTDGGTDDNGDSDG